MKKGKRKTKIIGSLIAVIIVVLAGLLGINNEQISKLANEIGLGNLINSESTEAINQNNITPVNGELQVYYIDVGQADSILIINKEDAMLIDAGNNEDGEDVVNFIKYKGITKLDYVVGTHPHEDHIGGLDDVINSNIEIENVLMPKIETTTKTFEDVVNAISNKGLTVKAPNKGDTFTLGDSNLEVMTDSILDEDNLNLSSITLRLQYGNNSFLFMGDSEKENEKTITWPKTDVLKVGHHGSDTSSSEEFLNEVKPSISIIMAGKDNSYGLPKEEIVERLENVGSKVYRTDENGTIEVTSDGNNINVTTKK